MDCLLGLGLPMEWITESLCFLLRGEDMDMTLGRGSLSRSLDVDISQALSSQLRYLKDFLASCYVLGQICQIVMFRLKYL